MSQSSPEGANESPLSFPVVAIGGSAGSLEGLQAFLENLPEDPGVAFVIVTHHPADKRTLLPQILSQRTELPITEAEDGLAVERNHIYVALSDGDWTLAGGRLVRQKGEERPKGGRPGEYRGPHHPVDAFFRSLAADLGDEAIGIVLSGTGTDGTIGTKAIKARAGMVMVQEPSSGEFAGMPSSAIATSLVDYILPPADMPPALISYVEAEARRKATPAEPAEKIPEATLAEILTVVAERTGHDFSGYKRSTLVRRLERRMAIHGMDDPEAYLRYLRRDSAETDLLFREAIISVTNFFRDPEAWEALAAGPLTEQLREAAATGQDFRAWVVGCATGEEAYTVAILVSECLEALGESVVVQIFASDVDTEAVETARVGRYPAGIAEDLSRERLARHFIAEEDTYRIGKPIRDMVVFAEHNVLQDPPFTRLNLVTCRNLLIYLERELQQRLLPLLQYALRPGGLLFLGTSESVGELSDAFGEVDKQWRVYRAEAVARQPSLPELPVSEGGRPRSLSRPGKPAGEASEGFTRSVERLLASELGPPSVLVNDRGDALYFHGHTGRFLEPAAGPAQNRLTEMAKRGLGAPLARALRESSGREAEPVKQRCRVQSNGGSEEVLLEVRPVFAPRALRGLRLVIFHPPAPAQEPEPAGGAAGESALEDTTRMADLQRDLEAARQDKQVTVEELQSSNEELQSVNEELQSMNEELQSSNEELEVSKEEVESLNEELRAVNAELEARVDELSRTTDDMKNLLDSTEIAILFLDEDMRITRFTKAASELIALRDSDLGRPVNELSTNLRYQGLTEDAREVLDTLTPKEVEVQTEGGHWYLLRIKPYRTSENVIGGLVCLFRDIQGAKRLEGSQSLFSGIMQTVRDPLLVLDPELRVVSANDGFYRAFPLHPKEVEGKRLFDVGAGQWDRTELRTLLNEVLPSREKVEDFELDLDFGEGRPGHVSMNARQLNPESGEPELILLAMHMPGGSRG